jgi:uncharacterized protein YeaO (DUF488 family)
MAGVQKKKINNIAVKRIYEETGRENEIRVLVDRMWPRGLSKREAKIDVWLKDVAPSVKLRKWFSHDPKKWGEFKKRYFSELKGKEEPDKILNAAKKGKIVLLYGSKDKKFNNAAALREYLEK